VDPLVRENERLNLELNELKEQVATQEANIVGLQTKLGAVENHKRSSEVRTGNIVEQVSPFLEGFPGDPKRTRFLGQPIDFIVFEDEVIKFVEVKSGRSKLSPSQRKVREHVEQGKVVFELFRISGE
jgi:predicted Holliday junction resolvase-like endonuclease